MDEAQIGLREIRCDRLLEVLAVLLHPAAVAHLLESARCSLEWKLQLRAKWRKKKLKLNESTKKPARVEALQSQHPWNRIENASGFRRWVSVLCIKDFKDLEGNEKSAFLEFNENDDKQMFRLLFSQDGKRENFFSASYHSVPQIFWQKVHRRL